MVDEYFRYSIEYSKTVTIGVRLENAGGLISVGCSTVLLPLAAIAWAELLRKFRSSADDMGVRRCVVLLVLVATAVETSACLVSGRAYSHYLASAWPALAWCAGIGIARIYHGRSRSRAQGVSTRIGTALLLLTGLACFFVWSGLILIEVRYPEKAAKRIRSLAAGGYVQPLGDPSTVAIALRAGVSPPGRYIYSLPLMEKTNSRLLSQDRQFLSDLKRNPPKLFFSDSNILGDPACSASHLTRADENRARQEGYDLQLFRELMHSALQGYKLVPLPSELNVCVYARE
jgi:hypothetical protein